ncbi:hypothetical protein GCM10010466_50130 [Planomonospora alba]|uniref:Uncharacterized protein n=1 Tax=Planomonospora alba TaxID=161354 RepID=A0ABP6NMA7_9ACTN
MTKHTTARRLSHAALAAALSGTALLYGAAPAAVAESAADRTAARVKGTLGPFGYGGVRLGMSTGKARATGKIVRKPGTGPCTGWDLKAHPTGRDEVGLYISRKRGVAMIFAPPGVKTPQGIRIGSTAGQMIKAYPKLKQAASGYATVSVPGNPRASYYFLLSHGEIYEIALALKNQDCAN